MDLAQQVEAVLLDSKDGGQASRQFWLTFYAMHLIGVLGLLATRWPTLSPNLPTLIGGILGALALQYGSQVAHKVNATSLAKTMVAGSPAEPPDPDPKP